MIIPLASIMLNNHLFGCKRLIDQGNNKQHNNIIRWRLNDQKQKAYLLYRCFKSGAKRLLTCSLKYEKNCYQCLINSSLKMYFPHKLCVLKIREELLLVGIITDIFAIL